MSKSDDNNKFRRGQGNAFKANNEVAFLAEEIRYSTFVHNYKLKAKFIIPALLPLMKSSTSDTQHESAKVKSKNGSSYKVDVNKVNYIEAVLPINIAWKFVIRSEIKQFGMSPNQKNMYIWIQIPKDTEFILSFVGDDINKARVTAVNDRSITRTGKTGNSMLPEERGDFY